MCGMYAYTPRLISEKSKSSNVNKFFFGKVLHGIRGSTMCASDVVEHKYALKETSDASTYTSYLPLNRRGP